jgi:hypothetical protein
LLRVIKPVATRGRGGTNLYEPDDEQGAHRDKCRPQKWMRTTSGHDEIFSIRWPGTLSTKIPGEPPCA